MCEKWAHINETFCQYISRINPRKIRVTISDKDEAGFCRNGLSSVLLIRNDTLDVLIKSLEIELLVSMGINSGLSY